jgi:hypothetical protein
MRDLPGIVGVPSVKGADVEGGVFPHHPIASLALLTDLLTRAAVISTDLKSDFMFAEISLTGYVGATFEFSIATVVLVKDLNLLFDETSPDAEDGFIDHWTGAHEGHQVSISVNKEWWTDWPADRQDPFQTAAVLQGILYRLAASLPEFPEVLSSAYFRSDGQIRLTLRDDVSATVAAETLHLAAEDQGTRFLRWSGTYTGCPVSVASFPDVWSAESAAGKAESSEAARGCD